MNPQSDFEYLEHQSHFHLNFDVEIVNSLMKYPGQALSTRIGNKNCTISVISPRYVELISSHYKDVLDNQLNYYHDQLKIPVVFSHFGIRIDFKDPTEIHLHDERMELPVFVKSLIKTYGVVILRNVFLDSNVRDMGHRNRFPQLNFHVDRIPSQGSFYSVYTRNPFDEEQRYPRTSSTLFIPTLVGYLQGLREGKDNILSDNGLINNAVLFSEDSITHLLDNVVVQHTWDQPEGVGEISMINNCNILHASYYPNTYKKGYRIGVRYLA